MFNMSSKFNIVDMNPRVIGVEIFSYLDTTSLARSSSVCIAWEATQDTNLVWQHQVLKLIGLIPNVQNYKDFLRESYSHKLNSNEAIIDAIHAFHNRASLGHNALFSCMIRPGSDYRSITIEIEGSKRNFGDLDFIENYKARDIEEGNVYYPVPNKKMSGKRKDLSGLPNHRRITHRRSSFQITLTFPNINGQPRLHETPMQQHIEHIMQNKLEKFENRYIKKVLFYSYGFLVVGLVVGCIAMKMYRSGNDSQ